MWVNKILIMFAAPFDVQGKCNIQVCQNFYCTCFFFLIYIFIYPLEDCHPAMARGLECLDDPLSFIS